MLKKIIGAFLLCLQTLSAIPYCDWCNTCWFDAEYLYWKIGDSPRREPGEGMAFHGRHYRQKWRSGARFASGFWFDDQKCFGVEANYFILPELKKRHKSFCDRLGDDPFFRDRRDHLRLCNDLQGIEISALSTKSFFRNNLILLGGFRWWNFTDSFPFGIRSEDLSRSIHVHDVKNNFYGAQIGAKFAYLYNCFFVNVVGKVALGPMFQSSKFQEFFYSERFPEENCSHHTHSHFSVLPEANVNIGYQISDCFRIQVGYTAMYATNVLFAAGQIPRTRLWENRTFRSDNLLVQGGSIGLELSF